MLTRGAGGDGHIVRLNGLWLAVDWHHVRPLLAVGATVSPSAVYSPMLVLLLVLMVTFLMVGALSMVCLSLVIAVLGIVGVCWYLDVDSRSKSRKRSIHRLDSRQLG